MSETPTFTSDGSTTEEPAPTEEPTTASEAEVQAEEPAAEPVAEEPQPEVTTEDVDFYYATKLDPARRATPHTSPYLDEVKREEAEIARAKIEGREPDLVNPPAEQGTPLFTKGNLASTNPVPEGHKADVTLPVAK